MFKIVFKFLKKIIMAAVLLYAYNRFAVSFNAVIPINFITIFIVAYLGIPAIFGIIIFDVMFF